MQDIWLDELTEVLKEYKKILIWGTGTYGKCIYSNLCNEGFHDKIECFIVSSKPEVSQIDDKSVVMIEQLEEFEEKSVILLAVLNPRYIREIREELQEIDHPQVIELRDYCAVDYNKLLSEESTVLRDGSFDQMLELMTECYLSKHKEDKCNFTLTKSYLSNLASDRICLNKKFVMFIVGTVYIRTAKIAGALRKQGYSIKIFKLNRDTSQSVGEQMVIENKIAIDYCNNIAEVLYKALEEKPYVYYIDPPFFDASLAMFMIHNKEKFGKIVFGEYDVNRVIMISLLSERDLLIEQYVLENADGVVWRYYAKDYLAEKFGYYYKGKSIQFYDYCEKCLPSNKWDAQEHVLKLCMLPTLLKAFVTKKGTGSEYTHEANIYEMIELVGDRSDCMLDIYSWSASREIVDICSKLEECHTNIRFYFHVNHSELIERMKQYDYGLMLAKKNDVPRFYERPSYNYIAEADYFFATNNKHFDFLAAGVPVVARNPVKQIEYLRQYGVVVEMGVENFDIDYLKKNKEKYHQQVAEALPSLLIDSQIFRLIDFIKEVGGNG